MIGFWSRNSLPLAGNKKEIRVAWKRLCQPIYVEMDKNMLEQACNRLLAQEQLNIS